MARAALDMPAADAQARENAAAFLKRVAGIDIAKCPHCHHGRWLTVAQKRVRILAWRHDCGATSHARP